MNRLLKTEISCMISRFDVKCTLVLSIAFGMLSAVLSDSSDDGTWSNVFAIYLVLIIAASGIAGLFISRDFTQNTIRNKLIVGHRRSALYAAKQIVTVLFFTALTVLFLTAAFITNSALVGTESVSSKAIITSAAVAFFAVLSVSGLTVFLAMTVKSSIGGALPVMCNYSIMFVSILEEVLPNNTAVKLINDIIPQCQIMVLNCVKADPDAAVHIIYSIVVFSLFYAGGYSIFRKTNLN